MKRKEFLKSLGTIVLLPTVISSTVVQEKKLENLITTSSDHLEPSSKSMQIESLRIDDDGTLGLSSQTPTIQLKVKGVR